MQAKLAALAAAVLSGTAAAAARPAVAQDRCTTGTVLIHVNECPTEEDYGTACLGMRGAEHHTVQPDRVGLYFSNIVYDFSLSQEDGGTTETLATVHDRRI